MREKQEVAPPRAGGPPPAAGPGRRTGVTDALPAPSQGRFITWYRIVEWSLIPIAFLILRFVPDRPTSLPAWLLLLVAGVLYGSPVALASYREFQRRREARSAEALAVEYQTRLGLTLGEAISPVADLLGHIGEARAGDRKRLQGQIRQRVVDACSELCGTGRSRCSFFELDENVMRPIAWAGRAEPPSTTFVKGEPKGTAAHEIVESRRRLLVPDVTLAPERAFIRPDGASQAFLTVPVYAGARNFGMLVVDSTEPGSLAESDLDVATALAQLLGAGLAVA